MENEKTSSSRLAKSGGRAIGRLMKSGLGSIWKSGKSIRTKLLVALLVLALIPLIVVGIITLMTSSNALMSKTFDNLEAVRANKTQAIENFLFPIFPSAASIPFGFDVSRHPVVFGCVAPVGSGQTSLR